VIFVNVSKVPPKGLPSNDDLKQMFVYNELLGGSRSMLLYPETSTSFAAAGIYATKQHTCEQHHVGLCQGAHGAVRRSSSSSACCSRGCSPSCGCQSPTRREWRTRLARCQV
jgi:hypothetical protein